MVVWVLDWFPLPINKGTFLIRTNKKDISRWLQLFKAPNVSRWTISFVRFIFSAHENIEMQLINWRRINEQKEFLGNP